MTMHINEILDIYTNFNTIGLYDKVSNEFVNIFVIADNDITLAIFEIYDDNEYIMSNNNEDFGRPFAELTEEYIDGGYEYRPL